MLDLIFLSLALGAYAQFNPCPLPGPVFVAPKLSSDSHFQDVTKNITDTLQRAIQDGLYPTGGPMSKDAAYSISIFSVDEPDLLYEFHHTPASFANASVGVREVDSDSVYRIASISKVYTVYAILAELGHGYWDRPVTDFLPDLAQGNSDAIDFYSWDKVSLGSLAGYTSGIGRAFLSYIPGQSNFPPFIAQRLSLPPLEPFETPACEFNETAQSCPTADVIKNINTKHPVYAPNSVVSYSNPAFQLLSLAVESIVGKPFEQLVEDTLIKPLSLNRTFSSKPDDSIGVIPGDIFGSLWEYPDNQPQLMGTSSGGYYASTSDVAAIGRSILASSILDSATTREWLKPHAHTASLLGDVGLPWEIFRAPLYGERVTNIYAKSGSLGGYTSNLVLLPDFNVGYTILVATPANTPGGFRGPNVLVSDILVPALEEIAREQTQTNFAGRYIAGNGLNSSMTLITQPDSPGLLITEFIMNSSNVLAAADQILGLPNATVRLYPTDLKNEKEDGTTDWAFRFNVEGQSQFKGTGPFSACDSWLKPDGYPYGVYSLDEYLFTIDQSGKALSITPRAWKMELQREE